MPNKSTKLPKPIVTDKISEFIEKSETLLNKRSRRESIEAIENGKSLPTVDSLHGLSFYQRNFTVPTYLLVTEQVSFHHFSQGYSITPNKEVRAYTVELAIYNKIPFHILTKVLSGSSNLIETLKLMSDNLLPVTEGYMPIVEDYIFKLESSVNTTSPKKALKKGKNIKDTMFKEENPLNIKYTGYNFSFLPVPEHEKAILSYAKRDLKRRTMMKNLNLHWYRVQDTLVQLFLDDKLSSNLFIKRKYNAPITLSNQVTIKYVVKMITDGEYEHIRGTYKDDNVFAVVLIFSLQHKSLLKFLTADQHYYNTVQNTLVSLLKDTLGNLNNYDDLLKLPLPKLDPLKTDEFMGKGITKTEILRRENNKSSNKSNLSYGTKPKSLESLANQSNVDTVLDDLIDYLKNPELNKPEFDSITINKIDTIKCLIQGRLTLTPEDFHNALKSLIYIPLEPIELSDEDKERQLLVLNLFDLDLTVQSTAKFWKEVTSGTDLPWSDIVPSIQKEYIMSYFTKFSKAYPDFPTKEIDMLSLYSNKTTNNDLRSVLEYLIETPKKHMLNDMMNNMNMYNKAEVLVYVANLRGYKY